MGFGEFLGNIAKEAVDSLKERAEKIERYKESLDRYDDKRLIKEYKSSSGDRKLAAGLLLKERGYGNKG